MRPMLSVPRSVNQSAPSGPAVMPSGMLFAFGSEYSVWRPSTVIRPIFPDCSVNQIAPSGPVTIDCGKLPEGIRRCSVMAPEPLTRAMYPAPAASLNQTPPSGPVVGKPASA